MSIDTITSALRALDEVSDTQMAELALRTDRIQLKSASSVPFRYVGTEQIEPGLPFGLSKKTDGSYVLNHVALVRVESRIPVERAEKLISSTFPKAIAISIASGVISAIAITFAFTTWHNRSDAKDALIAAPCLVKRMTEKTVVCRVGQSEVHVNQGSFFPDGKNRLEAIFPAQSGFSVTSINGQQILFQANTTIHNQR